MGIVLIAIAIMARGWGSVFTVGLTIASIVYGPMLGAFLLGVLTKSATERGAMAGIGVSLVAMIGRARLHAAGVERGTSSPARRFA